jgi:hypothetical protein
VCFYGGRQRASIGLLEATWKRSSITKSLECPPQSALREPPSVRLHQAPYPTQFEANFPFISISISLSPSCLSHHHTHARIVAFSSITTSSSPHVCGYFLACGRDAPLSGLLPNVDPVICHRITLRCENDLPLGHKHAVISSHAIRREAQSFRKRNYPICGVQTTAFSLTPPKH